MKGAIPPRVAEVVQIVRDLPGPATARQIGERLPTVALTNVHRFCTRGVGLGLLAVDRSWSPQRYSALPVVETPAADASLAGAAGRRRDRARAVPPAPAPRYQWTDLVSAWQAQ